MSTPLRMRSRASREKRTSFAAMLLSSFYCAPAKAEVQPNKKNLGPGFRRETGDESADDPQDVGFLHDEQVFAIDADLGARPLAEQDAVAGLDVERRHLAVFRLDAGAQIGRASCRERVCQYV